MLREFILYHFLISLIIFILLCILEAYLTMHKNWKIAIIFPAITFLWFIPTIIYLLKGGYFLIDTVFIKLIIFTVTNTLFVVCKLISMDNRKIATKADMKKTNFEDL